MRRSEQNKHLVVTTVEDSLFLFACIEMYTASATIENQVLFVALRCPRRVSTIMEI